MNDLINYVINNISFELCDTHQEFQFTQSYNANASDVAHLQLPDTSDSVHLINGIEEPEWSDEEIAIFQQLKDFFFDAFKDTECAAASALLAKNILHVEAIDDVYVAFTDNDAIVIKESPCRAYYNKAALFDFIDIDSNEIECTQLIARAKQEFFASLDRQLNTAMQNALDTTTGIDDAWINQAFDDVLQDFMKAHFPHNSDCDLAREFYEQHGCDTRIAFEDDAKASVQ